MIVKFEDSIDKEERKKIITDLWLAFNTEFPDEADRVEAVYKLLFPNNSYVCAHCGSENISKQYGARTLECRDCKMETWMTAGSFFDRVRKISPWLTFIWIMEKGIILNSSELSDLTGIATSSAQHILKKVAYVLTRRMEKQNMDAATSILFSEILCKRSRETPAREHPIAEIYELDKLEKANRVSRSAKPESNGTSSECKSVKPEINETSLDRNELPDAKRSILNLLSDKPLQIESLSEKLERPINELISNLTIMQLEGTVIRLPGESYIKGTTRQKDSANRELGHLKSYFGKTRLKSTKLFIKSIFQGISRKYLQYYLAVIWAIVECNDWINGQLLQECLDFGEIDYRRIHSFVSPKFVRVAPIN